MRTITRVLPDVQSTDAAESRRFYVDLLGFDVGMEQGDMLLFSSPSHSWVQLTINGDGIPLPPGFLVDVDSGDAVSELYEAAEPNGHRVVEAMTDKPWGVRRFSVLDPSGTRVTVMAHIEPTERQDVEDTEHPLQIVRAIPTVRTRRREDTRDFYVSYLGFEVCMDMPDMLMFCSPSHARVQVVATDMLRLPPGFDIDVGNVARVDELHDRAIAAGFVVVSPPSTVADAVRSFNVLDPNGVGVNVLAHVAAKHQTPPGASG